MPLEKTTKTCAIGVKITGDIEEEFIDKMLPYSH